MTRLWLLLLFLPGVAWAQMTQTRVAQGALEGVADGSVTAYLGIPFAAPPVGDLRWKAPRPPAPWSGVRKADHFAADCMQTVTPQGFGPWTHEFVIQGPVSEDCLHANVWTGASVGEKRPVMVWIYGGGFNSGGGSVAVYDGRALAAKGIVVVNFNYRVNVYGFLAHPGLTKEAGTSGNYGLLDQIAALKWVRDNISAFGGDPAQVTIVGQSAGAFSVHDLMNSPLATGLFVRAIAQSGSGRGIDMGTLDDGEAQGAAFQQATGAQNLAAMRALDPETLARAMGGTQFRPVVDGQVVTDHLVNDVPLLTGLTANESSPAGKPPLTPAEFSNRLEEVFGPLAGEAAVLYPYTDDAADAVARDRGLASMYLWDRDSAGHAPVYAYLWTHVEPGPDAPKYRAFHSSELAYVFGNFTPDRPFTAGDRQLSDEMQSYWVNFVKTGNPNDPGLPAWSAFTTADKTILQIDTDTHSRPVLDDKRLDLFVRRAAQGGKVTLF